MDNCKKIYVVNEFNKETNEWEIKNIVIFRDGDTPIIEHYDAEKHLEIINKFLMSNGFDFLNGGLNSAIEKGLVSVLSRENNYEMSELSSEIIQEQIKYGAKKENLVDENNYYSVEEEKSKTDVLVLADEDRELAQYFRLAMLRDGGKLPLEGLKEIERLASVNERAAALEEAKVRLNDGRLSKENYDIIYNTYRAQLATAIKNLSELRLNKESVENAKEESKPQFSDEDMFTFNSLMETIDLCRDARVGDEKFEIVIDKGLNNNSKREVRISLLNGFSRDSYTFEFNDGELFDSYINEILERASVNDKFVDLKQIPTSNSERIANSISLYSTKEGNQVLVRYSLPELAMVKVTNDDKVEEVAEELLNNENVEQDDFVRVTNDRLDLSQEDSELADYFRKDILRTRGQLPPVGLAEIERLASVNERVAALEDAKLRLNDGRLSQEKYNEMYTTYRNQLADSIRRVIESKSLVDVEENTKQKTLEMSKVVANSVPNKEDIEEEISLEDSRRKLINTIKAIRDKKSENEEQAIIDDLNNENNFEDKELMKFISELNGNEVLRNDNDVKVEADDNVDNVVKKENDDDINNNIQEENDNDVNNNIQEENDNDVNNNIQEENDNDVNNNIQKEQDDEIKDIIKKIESLMSEDKEKEPVVVLPEVNKVENLNDGAEDAEYSVKEDNKNEVADEIIDDKKSLITDTPKEVHRRRRVRVLPTVVDEDVSLDDKKDEKAYFDKPKTEEPKIDPSKPVQVAGKVVVTPEEEEVVDINGHKGKVKKTSKLKSILTHVLAGIAGIGLFAGLKNLPKNVKNIINNFKTSSVGKNDTIKNRRQLNDYIANYCNSFKVPVDTLSFLMRDEVVEFLEQYKNSEQLNEVLSALCYGYEANVLTTKDGNFRMAADGNTYLRSFTNDFLCAKVVVNGYSPEQMLNVFGGTDMSYEKVMDGFHGYLNTVSLYGTTAVEPLPFKYLTNNDEKSTAELNKLFDKLSVVNANRKAGTLNSLHTDAFIVAVDELFVQNDQSLGLSEGTKMVAAALVDAYMYSQAQVSNGEALYLHADYGLAKAGLNLQEVDGHFAIVSKDRTAYHFTSLLDVINYGYGNKDLVNSRCLTEQQILFENLNQMNNLSSGNERYARMALAKALYDSNMKELARQIADGKIDEKVLQTIEMFNPSLSDEIDAYEAAASYSNNTYIPFEVTVNGVDELLGIKGLTNDLATLHNIRRNSLYMYDQYEVFGKRYVKGGSYGYGYGGISVPSPKVTVTKEKVKVDYDDLTSDEKEQVQDLIEEHKKEEEKQHKEQLDKAYEGVDVLREAVGNGATQSELEKIGRDYGIEVDKDYQENMSQVLEQKEEGEKLAEKIDKENEERNAAAKREAEERSRREAEEQARRKAEQDALINGGGSSNSSNSNSAIDPGHVDTNAGEESYDRTVEVVEKPSNVDFSAIDPNFIDTEAGEEVYVGDVKSELTSMKTALASAVDVESLGLDEIFDKGRSLEKTRNV